ncbi:hypothetical protein JZ751_008846 [Albula glossodonta]|uniref:Uncharacterized protein n=1 Tax=Albula glossodonta TaxID=121402 RepID=A0A8T2P7V7_9TELE|nr:hypothetical protein JZ751_008846 [Albula glossodonta]
MDFNLGDADVGREFCIPVDLDWKVLEMMARGPLKPGTVSPKTNFSCDTRMWTAAAVVNPETSVFYLKYSHEEGDRGSHHNPLLIQGRPPVQC